MEVLRRVRALRRRREKSLVEDTLDLHLPSASMASPVRPHLYPSAALGLGLRAAGPGGGRSQSVSLLSCEDLNSLSSAELGLIFRDVTRPSPFSLNLPFKESHIYSSSILHFLGDWARHMRG